MPALRRWTRIAVLAGLCVGLFACLGGIEAADAFGIGSSVTPAFSGSPAVNRDATIDASPSDQACDCCSTPCSLVIDRARSSFDLNDFLTPLMLLGAAGAILYALSRTTPPGRWIGHERHRWRSHPTPVALCVILR